MLLANQSKTPKEHKDFWATPFDIFRGIENYLGLKFNLDACASPHNTKCKRYITAEMDCLTCDWGEKGKNVWINPPYSNPLPFVERAIQQCRENNHTIAMLLPADTSTKWFRRCTVYASRLIFIVDGRISFLNPETGKPKKGNSKGSVVVFFSKKQRVIPAVTTYVPLKTLLLFSEVNNQ